VWLTVFIGHKYLYESGVLHRDISPGNILIKWQPGSQAAQSRTSGCLIDLDHAKKGKLAPAKVNTSIDDTVICRVQDVFHAMTGIAVEKEVARLSLEFFPMVENNVLSTVTYISAALAHASNFRPLSGKPCTPQHLGWHSVRPHCSSFLYL
jgi:serine/threonine protein kinase